MFTGQLAKKKLNTVLDFIEAGYIPDKCIPEASSTSHRHPLTINHCRNKTIQADLTIIPYFSCREILKVRFGVFISIDNLPVKNILNLCGPI